MKAATAEVPTSRSALRKGKSGFVVRSSVIRARALKNRSSSGSEGDNTL